MAVMPSASITTSAASTAAADAVPTAAMRSRSIRIASPDAKGSRQSPETICPRLTMAIFMAARAWNQLRKRAISSARS